MEGVKKLSKSKLSDHIFKKGKFITPWNHALGNLSKKQSWSLNRFPEYLWIALILNKYDRKKGLEKSHFILLKCTQYNMIPYLRYDVVFRYLMSLGTNFINNEKMQKVLLKSTCAHLLYKMFDKTMVENIDFMKFVSCVKQVGLTEQINSKINQKVLDIKNYSVKEIIEILKSELNEIYKCVSESNVIAK